MHWSFSFVKMLKVVGTLIGFALTLAFTSGVADAQQVNGVWRLPAQSGTSTKGIARDPQPVVIVTTTSPFMPQSVFPRQPVLFTMIPAILLSDGSVLADFGFGFEPVVRSCGGTVVVAQPQVILGQPQVIGSNGVILSPGTPTFTQPVPNQQTPSQQMLPSAQPRILSAAAQTACFSLDGAGRVFVVR